MLADFALATAGVEGVSLNVVSELMEVSSGAVDSGSCGEADALASVSSVTGTVISIPSLVLVAMVESHVALVTYVSEARLVSAGSGVPLVLAAGSEVSTLVPFSAKVPPVTPDEVTLASVVSEEVM